MTHKAIYKRILLLIITVICFACAENKEGKCKITFYPKVGIDEKIYLSISNFYGQNTRLDSAIVKSNKEPIVFYVDTLNRIYTITTTFTNAFKVDFITDNNDIVVKGDFFARESEVTNSPATNSLKKFREKQQAFAAQITKYAQPPISADQHYKKALKAKMELFKKQYYQNFLNYCDTVKNPAGFMSVYADVDFGFDYKALGAFVNKAYKKFKGFEPIEEVKKDADDFISIMSVEFNPGQTLPEIALPDLNNHQFKTSTAKGKIMLIDFWGTWNGPSLRYNAAKKAAYVKFPRDKFQLVSVALEPEKENWKTYVQQNGFNWTQLIDEKVWKGNAVNTLKFDSIPFNFLVDKDGKVLAKAIKPEALVPTIARYLK